MSVSSGSRVGAYEIVSAIGAGGMGEVYRARDLKLNRDVAMKVLPEAFTRDPDRLTRFKREAQVLASLNHPNIAAIYGFEESSPSVDSGQGVVQALVLELVEGPTLADRIAQRPILEIEALRVAKQIAEALEAAHEQGIVHRDLKPANIKVRPDGAVKVLDFGIAKIATVDGGGPDLSLSPTVTSGATRDGVILGTAAYMSPEQARGKPLDKRTDIWSFGCVLYEMLTGGARLRARRSRTPSSPSWNASRIGPRCRTRRGLRFDGCSNGAWKRIASGGCTMSPTCGSRSKIPSRPRVPARWRHLLSGVPSSVQRHHAVRAGSASGRPQPSHWP
jgi:serine/threonine protein kinase